MTPFNMLWAPHQAAVYLLGSNEAEVRAAGYLWCYLRDQILEAAMGGRIHFIMAENPPVGDYPHDIELPGKRPELIEQERLRFKPVDVIEWALQDSDIPVSPECRSWFAKQAGTVTPDNTTEPFTFKMQREKDGYSPAIKEVAKTLYNELGKNANVTQAWNRLHSNPPPGYGIVSRKDHIEMPDELPLSRVDFSKRWRKANK